MTGKYKDKYRSQSNRLKHWDYGWVGHYFITLSCKNREHFFGEIKDKKMILSDIGKMAKTEWLNTATLRPDMNITIDEFCIMPNHFHAIIIIGENQYNQQKQIIPNSPHTRRDTMHRVSTAGRISTKSNPPLKIQNKFGPQRKNLSSIVRGFKSAITTYARKNNIEFAWQANYYDRIIRNEDELHKTREYIINNPINWVNDKHNKS